MKLQPSLKPFLARKRQYLIVTVLCLLLYSFSLLPILAPGIDQPSAIDTYLNGVFPNESPSGSGQNWVLENAYPNLTFADPMVFLELPDQEHYYLVSKLGLIFQLADDPTIATVDTVLNISDRVDTGVDNGVSNVVLHPEFGQPDSPNRGYLYLYYRYHPDGNQDDCEAAAFLRLSRFNRPDGSTNFDPNSELVLIQTFDEQCYHSGGAMFFDQEGYLYLATGDAGGSGDHFQVTQRVNGRLMSGLLRIDVDKDATRSHPIRRQQVDPDYRSFTNDSSYQQGYYIPNDNPFLSEDSTGLEEFYAIGLRAPHRGSIDTLTGEIWIADVGQSAREEISIVPKGGNMQWPFMEGFFARDISPPNPLIGISTPPIYDYDHTVGNAIIGGFLYRGNYYQGALNGRYIFGDHGSRNIWTYNPSNQEVIFLANAPDFGVGDNNGISSFATNAVGEIFVLKLFGTDEDGGVIYKLKQGNTVPEPPQLLSQTGAFSDLINLTPASGIVPYTVNAPLWSDRAAKKRWIALPNDGTHDTEEEQIAFSEKGDWQFPAGTVFIKHFELPVDYNNPAITKRLETRFFVITDDGGAYGVTYKWTDDGTDAELLVNSDTKDFAVTFADGSSGVQTWTYPSRAACMTCHTANAGFVLGVHTWQLNGNLTYPSGITDNQLNTWQHLGMFANPFDPADISSFLRSANINDASASMETKVRSYLDANCSNCHRPNGVDGAFDARFSTPLAEQGILWTHGLSRNTPAAHYMIKPLDTAKSEIWIRDGSLEENAMPPLAKSLIDEAYMEVLTAWIGSQVAEACVELPVSDLKWTNAQNLVGPVEIDASNGENSAGDGVTISINGQTFSKGLGVHAPSEITYTVNGDYASFQSYVGIDDEVADCSSASMQFEVYADGQLMAQSPVMRPNEAPFLLEADITGAKEVTLVATVGGDNESCDHGDWANPRFLTCGDCEPNTPCNDGDSCTINDTYDEACHCVGTVVDTDGDGISDECDACPGADDTVDVNNNGIPDGCDDCIVKEGQACDDGDSCTVDDRYDNNCNCAGTFTDTDNDGVSDICDACPGSDDSIDTNNNGKPDGCDLCLDLKGKSCDDGDPCTENDRYGDNCNCVGTLSDTDGDGTPNGCDLCPGGDDRIDTNNNGIPDACEECALKEGKPCDDGDPCTVDDRYDNDCNCIGTIEDSDGDTVPDVCDQCPGWDDLTDDNNNGIPDHCDECFQKFGLPCDDGDPCTSFDRYDDLCNCAGSSTDSDGDGISDECDLCPGGDDTIDTNNNGIPDGCDDCIKQAEQTCDDGDACTVNDRYDSNCNCTGTSTDSDGDQVPDVCDLCPGSDDKIDANNNGIPDGCDEESAVAKGPRLNIFTNPVSSDIVINYKLAQAGLVGIMIRNLRGEMLLRPLPPTQQEAGGHELRFSADLPVGIYYVQLEYEDGYIQEKIVLTPNRLELDRKKILKVVVKPNPFHNEFKLLINQPYPGLKRAVVRIMDMSGRIIYQKFNAPFNEEINIVAHDGWGSGVYLMQIHASDYSFTQTIVKQQTSSQQWFCQFNWRICLASKEVIQKQNESTARH